jgi:plastocyanin
MHRIPNDLLGHGSTIYYWGAYEAHNLPWSDVSDQWETNMGRKRHQLLLVLAMLCMTPFVLAAAKQQAQAVTIDNMQFSPSMVSIKIGDTVTWTNNDDRDHTVVAADGSFKSENLRPGASYSYQFTKSGKFAYACSYHPRMKGMVSVADK